MIETELNEDDMTDVFAQLLAAGLLNEGQDEATCTNEAALPCDANFAAAAGTKRGYTTAAQKGGQIKHQKTGHVAEEVTEHAALGRRDDEGVPLPVLKSKLGRKCALEVALEELLNVNADGVAGDIELCLCSELGRMCAKTAAAEEAQMKGERCSALTIGDTVIDDGMAESDEDNRSDEGVHDGLQWSHLAQTVRSPRGFKSVEHLEVLRQSDPCYGTLAPRKDRPAAHELTYDPVGRFCALARQMRTPRGFKSVEHLEVLRQSDPCYGTLAPRKDRPAAHELTYDPVGRFCALARYIRTPKGSKTPAHLSALRITTGKKRSQFNLAELATSRMPRNTSVASFVDDDQLPELPSLWRQRLSNDGYASDDASERSAARTMERCSNDTIGSYLDDSYPASPFVESTPGKKMPSRAFMLPSNQARTPAHQI